MTRSSAFLARILAACLAVSALPAAAVVIARDQVMGQVPDQLIVRFRDDARVVDRDAQMLRLGAEPVLRFGGGHNTLLRLPAGSDLKLAVARLKASGLVEYAHPNHVMRKLAQCSTLVVAHQCPNDTNFNNQFHLHNAGLAPGGAESDADMDMPEAWSLITASSVLLAIIDDGFDLSHPDLDANLQDGLSCNEDNVACGGTAQSQSSAEAHGTMVAGSAAAVGNNGSQVAGVMWSANVLPLRMPHYTSAEVIMSVDYAIAQNAKVINMSFGSASFDQGEMDAIDRARQAGILVAASAGNEDSSIDKSVTNFPANYAVDNIVAVAASDAFDAVSSFSNWGSFSVELAAAGDGVVTTERGGGIGSVDGTSFSSPITAGAAALIGQYLSNNGNSTWDYHELKARLIAGADNASDTGDLPLRGRVAGGRVNVHKSLLPLTGGVLVARGLSFSDPGSIVPANDNDGLPDPGETLDMIVQLENVWQSAGTVDAVLSTTDANATVTDGNDTTLSIGAFGTGTATFRVQLASFTGNEQILFKLELTPQTGAAQTRYFYLEVGTLRNGTEVSQQFRRNNWDEFHAWHANVPTGAANIRFETHTSNAVDIDLIARRNTPPTYFADLATHGTSETCDAGDPCIQSATAAGEETLTPSQTGLWHLVVLDAAGTNHTYRMMASWDAAGAGTVRFAAPTLTLSEVSSAAVLQVVRSGGTGAVSVGFTVTDGSAVGGSDFTFVTGTLNWASGDTAAKEIVIPMIHDGVAEPSENFTVTLSNPAGGADIGRYSVSTVTITDTPTSGGGGGGGGGGTTDLLLLGGLAALLAARRRRPR